MSMLAKLVAMTLVTVTFHPGVQGHGRLVEPPSRSSMWRYGFPTPINYNDNQLFCGGRGYQWIKNHGRCGVCGDPWDATRENEAGGKYANGFIARTYAQGQQITVNIDLTANHKGYFEFRLCPQNNVQKPVTQACLDRHLLRFVDGRERYDVTSSRVGIYPMELMLPARVACSQCVIQWKYNTGNSWGCENGVCCVGCGPQEQFYGCADVTIIANTENTTKVPGTHITSTDDTTVPTTIADKDAATTTASTKETGGTSSSEEVEEEDTPCQATGAWLGDRRTSVWCGINCRLGFCPQDHCSEACRRLVSFPS